MTLRVLPPGGGGGDGEGPNDLDLTDPNADRNAIAAAMADKAMALAQVLTTSQRRFAERWAQSGNAREALLHAWPDLRDKTEATINKHLGLATSNHNVRAYIAAIRGEAALTAGITYTAVLEQLWHVATSKDNPGYVQGAALATLASELRRSGAAAREGLAPVDKKALGKGGGEAGAIDKPKADHWLDTLGNSPPVPIMRSKPA